MHAQISTHCTNLLLQWLKLISAIENLISMFHWQLTHLNENRAGAKRAVINSRPLMLERCQLLKFDQTNSEAVIEWLLHKSYNIHVWLTWDIMKNLLLFSNTYVLYENGKKNSSWYLTFPNICNAQKHLLCMNYAVLRLITMISSLKKAIIKVSTNFNICHAFLIATFTTNNFTDWESP